MRRTRLQLSGDCWVEMEMTLLRFEPRLRRGRSFEGRPDMVGADEDQNRRWEMGDRIWDIGRKIKIKIKMKIKEAAGYRLKEC